MVRMIWDRPVDGLWLTNQGDQTKKNNQICTSKRRKSCKISGRTLLPTGTPGFLLTEKLIWIDIDWCKCGFKTLI